MLIVHQLNDDFQGVEMITSISSLKLIQILNLEQGTPKLVLEDTQMTLLKIIILKELHLKSAYKMNFDKLQEKNNEFLLNFINQVHNSVEIKIHINLITNNQHLNFKLGFRQFNLLRNVQMI
jgi:hypothetical protein